MMKTLAEKLKLQLQKKEVLELLFLYIAAPFVINFVIVCFGLQSVWDAVCFQFLHPLRVLCNGMIIMLTASVTLLTKRRPFWAGLVYLSWLILGIANGIILSFRVTPLGATDFRLFSDLFSIIFKYLSIGEIILIVVLLLLVFVCLGGLWVWLKGRQKRFPVLQSLGMIFGIYLATSLCLNLGVMTGTLERRFGELSKSYQKNGFVYCFFNSVVNTGVRKPNNYSIGMILGILGYEEETTSEQPTKKPDKNTLIDTFPEIEAHDKINKDALTPNIIVVQLESFFDVSDLVGVTYSTDPLPIYHKLMAEWPSGHLSMPCVGAGTVNSEFEILTGMNLDDFGMGEYPYKTVLLEETCENLAYILKKYGYKAQAIHNNTGGFYGRNKVFANLGFDTFTSVEYMNVRDQDKTVMGWAKDRLLTEQIFKALESTEEKDFLFTISVQAHGSYPSDQNYIKRVFSLDVTDESRRESFDYYLNQLYEVDEFVGSLLWALSDYPEDTVVVFYGDHLPSLGISDEDMVTGTVYTTSYLIWNNMGLTMDDEDLEAYQLMSRVLEKLGISNGVLNRYHQTNKDVPQEEYLEGLRYLEYDMLYGDRMVFRGENPYEPTELQMGITPITIEDVYADILNETVENCMVVKGTGFTQYSQVEVNGSSLSTTYLDETTLLASHVLQEGDEICVSQKGLSKTDVFLVGRALPHIPHNIIE